MPNARPNSMSIRKPSRPRPDRSAPCTSPLGGRTIAIVTGPGRVQMLEWPAEVKPAARRLRLLGPLLKEPADVENQHAGCRQRQRLPERELVRQIAGDGHRKNYQADELKKTAQFITHARRLRWQLCHSW